jgi:hypothetical protein
MSQVRKHLCAHGLAYAFELSKENKHMEEMIKAVAEKAGISPDQAKMAVETVVGMLKDKLPGPAQMALDSVMGGGAGAADAAKGALGGIAGKLGL